MGYVEVSSHEELAGFIGAVDGDGVSAILDEALNDGLIRFLPDDNYGLTSIGWDEFEESVEISNAELQMPETKRKRVFIGHGGSKLWRDLKDYLVERLGLDFDEFNREATAGYSNKERLSQMLDEAGFAFLVMTGEDETKDGKMTARMNVVHEAGLFQGRLGFEKAIVLLEDGCESFSNIDGLVQIRFPKGNIDAKRDEIRRVLEREGMVEDVHTKRRNVAVSRR
ncbi:TIR domain-containing protein [Mesorhizobium sp. Cs1321R2N1]|uniref:TIR domain-containing protein n=1 Tax=Mesorhizobium sp. Cs1321R2N1 TaxID=3015174 RepID=UPI00301E44A5